MLQWRCMPTLAGSPSTNGSVRRTSAPSPAARRRRSRPQKATANAAGHGWHQWIGQENLQENLQESPIFVNGEIWLVSGKPILKPIHWGKLHLFGVIDHYKEQPPKVHSQELFFMDHLDINPDRCPMLSHAGSRPLKSPGGGVHWAKVESHGDVQPQWEMLTRTRQERTRRPSMSSNSHPTITAKGTTKSATWVLGQGHADRHIVYWCILDMCGIWWYLRAYSLGSCIHKHM